MKEATNVSYYDIEAKVIKLMGEYGKRDQQLMEELTDLLRIVKDEQENMWKIKDAAFALANKLC